MDVLSNHVGTLIVLCLLGAFFAYAVLLPGSWRFIRNRWVGIVIRFEQPLKDDDGNPVEFPEGPIHVWPGIERVIRAPKYDIPIHTRIEIVTAAPNPVRVTLELAQTIQFGNPLAVVMSVPDREPIEEYKRQVFGPAVVAAGQSVTVDQLTAANAIIALEQTINGNIMGNELVTRWGLVIVETKIVKVLYPQSYLDAVQKTIDAQADAQATVTRAQGEVDAVQLQRERQGDAMFVQLEQLQTLERMAEKGALKTVVTTSGLADLARNLLKFMD